MISDIVHNLRCGLLRDVLCCCCCCCCVVVVVVDFRFTDFAVDVFHVFFPGRRRFLGPQSAAVTPPGGQ